ncbi:hypothetical protein Salat_2500600 [Sesamum alatum]|uniref:Uncharacterized protein n=1 Tax=Sesamum alatum TaxID=300844 RepID=A0AAE2CC79_9LAMI|nr:hypothetical protein Salat_2500600 [Sesamum alatum]
MAPNLQKERAQMVGDLGQGYLQLCRPRSLCFRDGPEAGTHLFGRKLRKWPRVWGLGLILNAFMGCREPWQWPRTRRTTRAVKSTTLLLLLFMLRSYRKRREKSVKHTVGN